MFSQDVNILALIQIPGLPYSNNVDNGRDFGSVYCISVPFSSQLPKWLLHVNKPVVHNETFLENAVNFQLIKCERLSKYFSSLAILVDGSLYSGKQLRNARLYIVCVSLTSNHR